MPFIRGKASIAVPKELSEFDRGMSLTLHDVKNDDSGNLEPALLQDGNRRSDGRSTHRVAQHLPLSESAPTSRAHHQFRRLSGIGKNMLHQRHEIVQQRARGQLPLGRFHSNGSGLAFPQRRWTLERTMTATIERQHPQLRVLAPHFLGQRGETQSSRARTMMTHEVIAVRMFAT